MSVIWLAGQSGSGKTTTSLALREKLKNIIILDGDQMRATINRDLDLSPEGRKENNLRIARLASLLSGQGHVVIVAVIAPYKEVREEVTSICSPTWIHIDRGLPSTTDRPFEGFDGGAPIINTLENTPEECADLVLKHTQLR